MISSLHLATTFIFDVSRRWCNYLNRCVVVLDSEMVEALGASVPFSLEPILVNMEGGALHQPNTPSLTGRSCCRKAANRQK